MVMCIHVVFLDDGHIGMALCTGKQIPFKYNKKKSEYDPEIEIPQSQTADNAVAPLGRAAQPSWDTRKTN